MDARIRFLLRFIEERGGTLQITSKQIASMVGLGETRVLRLFRAEMGRTLRQHLREVRMARAVELLRNDNLPIKTIAFSCGYSLVSNFHRDFKLVYGISPKQMRLMRMNLQAHGEKPVPDGVRETPKHAPAATANAGAAADESVFSRCAPAIRNGRF